MSVLLEIQHLSVSFRTPQGEVEAVRDVSLSLRSGEVLAIVGESGCGKSVLCRSVMKLLPKNGWIKSGTILAEGTDITHCTQRDMERLRGRLFSMVFQDPLTALTPAMTVGAQIAEAVRVRQPREPRAAVRRRVDPNGKPAETEYRVLSHTGGRALVELTPHTGRTHQLRVHMAALGCPLTGDWLYGTEDRTLIARPALHAARLALRHPASGEELALDAPLPEDMRKLLER